MGLRNRPQVPLELRFWKHVTIGQPDECWPWTGAHYSSGYGNVGVLDDDLIPRTRGAHRIAWELRVGPIPPGLSVLHRCDTPACVNPDHLFLGTHADNMADMVAKGREARGTRNGQAKLTEQQVGEIRLAHGTIPFADLAARFGISRSQLARILNGERWRTA